MIGFCQECHTSHLFFMIIFNFNFLNTCVTAFIAMQKLKLVHTKAIRNSQ